MKKINLIEPYNIKIINFLSKKPAFNLVINI